MEKSRSILRWRIALLISKQSISSGQYQAHSTVHPLSMASGTVACRVSPLLILSTDWYWLTPTILSKIQWLLLHSTMLNYIHMHLTKWHNSDASPLSLSWLPGPCRCHWLFVAWLMPPDRECWVSLCRWVLECLSVSYFVLRMIVEHRDIYFVDSSRCAGCALSSTSAILVRTVSWVVYSVRLPYLYTTKNNAA